MPQPRKGRGCMFYGCLTCVVLLLLACALAVAGAFWVKNRIYAFTDAAPKELPKVEMADAEFQALQQRLQTFGDAMEKKMRSEPLTLTEREINALLAKSPNMKDLADKVYVSLHDDQVKGQVSIPLNGLVWFGRGRYLNGEAAFNVSLENGVLIVTAQEIQVHGKPIPESVMSALRQENLAKDAYKNPEHAEALRKLDSIHVQNDTVIITARAPAPTAQ
jgi:hypothetical protein